MFWIFSCSVHDDDDSAIKKQAYNRLRTVQHVHLVVVRPLHTAGKSGKACTGVIGDISCAPQHAVLLCVAHV